MSSLKKLAIQGTIWTFISYGTGQFVRFLGNVVLTRLLTPEYFGLMTIVNVFLTGLELFSDLGVGQSIIQNSRGEEDEFRRTAWTIQAIRGTLLWMGCFLIAWPASQLYGERQLLWLIPIVGFGTFLSGLDATAAFVLKKRVQIRDITLFTVGIQILGVLIMIAWALVWPSIWALVIGGLTSKLVKAVISHRLVPEHKDWFYWDKSAVKEILSFGKWIFVATVMTFLSGQSDRLILGKLLSLSQLGVYSVAFTLSELPRQILLRVSNGIIFPIVSKQADLPRHELRKKILKGRKAILAALSVGIALMAGFGDILIGTLYDSRYQDATWMITLLSVGIWPFVLYSTTKPVLMSIGKSIYAAQGDFLRFILIAVGLPIGFNIAGLLGVIVVISLNDLPPYFVNQYGVRKEKLSGFGQDVLFTALMFGLLSAIFTVRVLLGYPPTLFDLISV